MLFRPTREGTPQQREVYYFALYRLLEAGLFAPSSVPEPIIMQLRRAMREAMQSPQLISVFEKAGSPPAYLDGPDFARFIETDSARLIPAVRKIGKVE